MTLHPSTRRVPAVVIAAAALLAAPSPGAVVAQPPAADETPVFGSSTAAVVVDVVVRDKKGRLVRDLRAEDFDLREDGVKQTIGSFQVFDQKPESVDAPAPTVAPSAAPAAMAPASTPAAPPAASHPAPAVIAFVFDRMSADGRGMARKAALTYADHGRVEGDVVGVFAVDQALRTVEPFTEDQARIRRALERASAEANTQYASTRDDARAAAEKVRENEDAIDSLPGQDASSQTTAGRLASDNAMLQIRQRMDRTFDALERDQQGYATTNALMAVVNGLKNVQGRKTIVFFSEGMAIPANVEARFRSVIASANRANVSVYAIDAGGLRAESTLKESRQELMNSTESRRRTLSRGEDTSGRPMTQELERNEDILRLNPHSGLGQLAEETGGLLIHDTNDASSAFRKLGEDMRFHYLLSYSPTNASYDGTFRTISVKVSRPNVDVQSRKGYIAVKPTEFLPVRDTNEAAAVADLDRTPAPHAFPMRVGGMSFPEGKRVGLVPVIVEIPGTAVSYTKKAGSPADMQADFTVLVRVRDASNHEVDRLSEHYVLTVPASKLDAARTGDVLFYRETELPPGHYTLQAVTHDAIGQKAAVTTSALDVPQVDKPERLRLSTVVILKRVEKLTPQEQSASRPLFFGEAALYPNLGEPLKKAASPYVGFFFTAYGGAQARGATIELLRDGKVVSKAPTALPAPDASGRVQYAGTLPLQGKPDGDYRIRVTVSDGAASDVGEAAFTLAE